MSVSIAHPTDRPNFSRVSVNGLTLWFSYETCIAFQTTGNIVISENVWSKTTGKHLNYLSEDKSRRMPREDFVLMLKNTLTAYGL